MKRRRTRRRRRRGLMQDNTLVLLLIGAVGLLVLWQYQQAQAATVGPLVPRPSEIPMPFPAGQGGL